jgi:hypothetical protein
MPPLSYSLLSAAICLILWDVIAVTHGGGCPPLEGKEEEEYGVFLLPGDKHHTKSVEEEDYLLPSVASGMEMTEFYTLSVEEKLAERILSFLPAGEDNDFVASCLLRTMGGPASMV